MSKWISIEPSWDLAHPSSEFQNSPNFLLLTADMQFLIKANLVWFKFYFLRWFIQKLIYLFFPTRKKRTVDYIHSWCWSWEDCGRREIWEHLHRFRRDLAAWRGLCSCSKMGWPEFRSAWTIGEISDNGVDHERKSDLWCPHWVFLEESIP